MPVVVGLLLPAVGVLRRPEGEARVRVKRKPATATASDVMARRTHIRFAVAQGVEIWMIRCNLMSCPI